MEILQKYKLIFSTSKLDMGKTNLLEHEIRTTDDSQ